MVCREFSKTRKDVRRMNALFAAIVLGLLSDPASRVVVVEAQTKGEPAGSRQLGAGLSASLHAMPSSEAAARFTQRLPPVIGGTQAAPVIQAGELVQRGREAYLDGRLDEAASQLAEARDLLKRAIDSFD